MKVRIQVQPGYINCRLHFADQCEANATRRTRFVSDNNLLAKVQPGDCRLLEGSNRVEVRARRNARRGFTINTVQVPDSDFELLQKLLAAEGLGRLVPKQGVEWFGETR